MTIPSFDSILETTAVLTSVGQFLSGILICRKWIKLRSTGDSSGVPYLWGFLSCSFWLRYGVLSNEKSVALVNVIGASLFLLYLVCFYIFTVNKASYLKQFALTAAFLFGIIFWTNTIAEPSDRIYITGIICCVITVGFFAAPLTMLFHVIRVKNAESLPFPLIVMSFLSSLQWLIYGIIISDTFIQIPNFLGCVLSMFQLLLFVCYPPKTYTGQGYKLVESF